jgi:hypothetical protein
MPWPTCPPRRPRRADPAVLHCRAAARRGRATAAPTTLHHADPRHAQGPLSHPLSLPLCLHAASTSPGPLPAAPLKTEPPTDLFLPPHAVCLTRPRPCATPSFPLSLPLCLHAGMRVLQRAAQAICPAGLGCQAVAQPAFWPTARSWPPCPVGCSLGPVSAQYCATVFKCFSIVSNFRNCFKLQKFVETCRNVQKLQNKFCMNPLEPLFTVGLTKLTFTW